MGSLPLWVVWTASVAAAVCLVLGMVCFAIAIATAHLEELEHEPPLTMGVR